MNGYSLAAVIAVCVTVLLCCALWASTKTNRKG